MSFFFFHHEGGETAWNAVLADQREAVMAKGPAFTTILDVDHSFTPLPEDLLAVHYRGGFYMDLDAASIEDAIVDAKATMGRLKTLGVDLNTLEIYASGGKGFHFVVPMAVFVDKMPRCGGYTKLPLIYKDMAMEHFLCPTLDMVVYSTKRGRMWRTANIKRSNGLYKVRVTEAEVMEMTPESYKAIASAPRFLPPPTKPTTPAIGLSTAFAQSIDVVAARFKNKAKSKVSNEQIKKRYDGKFPPLLVKLLSGDVQSTQGFQATALQVAIAAVAVGKSKDEMVAEAEGLLKNHSGDSDRYSTYGKRREALGQVYHSVENDPSYQFSLGGVKFLLAKEDQELSSREEGQTELARSVTQGVYFNQAGIYHCKDEEITELSKLGFGSPRMLLDVKSQKRVLGYIVDVFHHGEGVGSEFLEVGVLQSKQRFQAFASAYSAAIYATDVQVVALMELLKHISEMEGNTVFATAREGLDLIKPEGATSIEDFDIAWISKDKSISKKGRSYEVKSEDQEYGIYRSDLMTAGGLQGSEAEADILEALFNVNTPYVVGAMVGWFAAAHCRMIFDHFYGQFPLLQVFGQAGAGKSKTVELMLRMHYLLADPKITSAGDITMHALQAACSASASIPAVFDEYKVREVQKARIDMLRRMFKNAYTRAGISKGYIDHDGGTSKVALRNMNFNAPVCFIGEAIESQTAILERSVVVNLTKEGRLGRKHSFDKAFDPDNRAVVSRLGCAIVTAILDGAWEKLKGVHDKNRTSVDQAWGETSSEGDDRQRFNVAVVITGLDYARAVISKVHGDRFHATFEILKEATLHASASRTLSVVRKVRSELSKVIASLAYLSNEPPKEDMRVHLNKEYTLDGNSVDIKAQACFDKYRAYCKHVGQESMYDSFDAFVTALETYDGTVKGAGGDNMILRDGPRTKVYRLSLDKLANEDVDSFRGEV